MGTTYFVALYRVAYIVKTNGVHSLLHHVMSDILKTNGIIRYWGPSLSLSVPTTKWDKFGACVHGHFVPAPFPSEADNPDGLS